jgi:hypothetical protein
MLSAVMLNVIMLSDVAPSSLLRQSVIHSPKKLTDLCQRYSHLNCELFANSGFQHDCSLSPYYGVTEGSYSKMVFLDLNQVYY